MGPQLGPVFDELLKECASLHLKWHQFVELYGTKPERVDLLNKAAGFFFWIVQRNLQDDVLLGLARLTDSPASSGQKNLTLQRLAALITDAKLRADVEKGTQDVGDHLNSP